MKFVPFRDPTVPPLDENGPLLRLLVISRIEVGTTLHLVPHVDSRLHLLDYAVPRKWLPHNMTFGALVELFA